ncbi:type VII secretion protein EccB [Streptomyces sp. NPDC048663]|uniref:type VII secretion protein EccB n=1 Tax=Streptomyces sp. NPDC048663 TaxID=3155638 RepID=UPI00342A287A
MQSRRDHLHAYQFATGRLASALVSGDPGTGEAPMRRSGLGSMFGVFTAVLLILVSVVYGVIKPVDNTSWKKAGALVVEKETGNRYIYVGGVLHPTVNYASALLLAGGSTAVQQVSRSSMDDVPRGAPLGIPGAPDDVAQPSALLTGSWTDCLRAGSGAVEALDFAPRSAREVPDNARVFVSGPDGTRYVLWRNTKYPVDGRSSAVALGLDTEQPVSAPSAWLDALPTGTTIAAAHIPEAGNAGGTLGGTAVRYGQLFRTVVSGADHFYVLRHDGIASLTATEAALLATAPGGKEPRRVSPNDIAAVRASSDNSLLHRIPDLLKGTDATADAGSALCLLRAVDHSGVRSTVVRETGRVTAAGTRVIVPPAHAVLAVPPKKPGSYDTPDPCLITEQGVKYPLAGQAVDALGYSGISPRTLPAATLDLIPTGPQLSRARATAAVAIQGGS